MHPIVEQVKQKHVKQQFPEFAPGDTVRVNVKVTAVSYTHLTLPTIYSV